VRNHLQPVALALGTLVLSGCATGHGGSLAGRFVRPGTPAMDYGGPKLAQIDSLSDHMTQVRHLSARPARQGTFGPTVESSDQQLAAALLIETIQPTAESHRRVAQEYRRLGLLDSAYKRLNRAVQKEPRNAAVHEDLARIWRDWGLPDQGLGAAYRAAYLDPRSASAQNTLGTILDALGRFQEARRAYEHAIALEPTAAWAFNNLCYGEFRSGHLREARARCAEALRLEPTMAAAHNNLALTYAAAGDLERALEEFRAAGDPAAAQYNLGILHLAERDYASAAIAFEEAIKSRPTYTAAKEQAHAARVRVLPGTE
jgi:tetratricopeptide (TPR) repeat protein